jgi:hypothetical protein
VDNRTEELLVRSYAKHDEGYKIPNVRKALFRSIEEVMSAPLRSAAAHLLVTLGLTVPETVWPSQQPAASASPLNGNQQQQPDRSPNGSTATALPAAAAAAIEIILVIRLGQQGTDVKNPARWKIKTRPLLVTEHRDTLLKHLEVNPDATDVELVVACGFSDVDIIRARVS